MPRNSLPRFISVVTIGLVGLLALGSFSLSYSALRDIALQNGITGNLSYIWPLLIDASLIIFSLSVVNAHLHNRSTWWQWGLVGLYTILTISFNVLHAPGNLQARIVAAIAPVSLFFSFELLMSQLRQAIGSQESKTGRKSRVGANKPVRRAASKQPSQADYNLAARLRSEGFTWPEVANRLNRSESTAKAWAKRAAEGVRNGNG